MPNFKIIRFLVFVLLAILVLVDSFLYLSNWYYFGLFAIFFTCICLGSFSINAQFFIPIICHLPTDQKIIALTFDDGPDETNTPLILEALRQHQAQATFFCIGHKVNQHKNLLQRMKSEGHAIGNHSFSHSYFFDFFSKKRVIAELEQTQFEIKRCIGKTPSLFRPPYGVTNPPIANAVKALKIQTIGWNIRSLDTLLKKEETILRRIIAQIKPGSIVLLHDTKAHSVEVTKKLLIWLKENNYQTVNLEDYFHKKWTAK